MLAADASAFLTASAASLVECVEALTVVLAVGVTRGWRSALAGAAGAIALLAALLAVFGTALLHVPSGPARIVLGGLLLLFGLRWLRKSTRRAAGLIAMRDEDLAFDRHRRRIASLASSGGRWDAGAVGAAFQATAIEGLEVVFLVVAIGSGGSGLLGPAIAGAVFAFAVVMLLGAMLHRPIARIPDNTLKRAVGCVLSGFGTFWVGEGAGLAWPAQDAAVPLLVACYALLSVAMAGRMRARAARVVA